MSRSIYTKLLLLVALPLALLITSVILLQMQITQVDKLFTEHKQTVERPLEIFNDIAINLYNVGLAVNSYLLIRNPDHIKAINNNFQSLEADLNQLHTYFDGQPHSMEGLRSLRQQLGDYRNIVHEIIRAFDQFDHHHVVMTTHLDEIDRILDTELQPLAKSGDSGQFQKSETLLELEININEIASGAGKFLFNPDPGLLTQVEDDIDNVSHWYESYAALPLTEHERELALQVKKEANGLVGAVREILAINMHLAKRIENLPLRAQAIETFIQQRLLQPYLQDHETEELEIAEYTQTVMLRSKVILAAGLLTMLIILLYISQGIIRPIRRLTAAVEAGSLEHLTGAMLPGDELGILGDAFRRIIEKLHSYGNKMQERENFLSITLNSMGDGAIITDTEGRIARLNPIAENLTGWTNDEAQGRPADEIFRIIHEDTRIPCPSPFREVLDRGRPLELGNYTVLIARDGREFVITDSAAPIRGEDQKILGCVLIFRDTTEKVRQQKVLDQALKVAKESARIKGDFLANMSHEIRTPMNAITGMAHLLEDTKLDNNQKSYVQNMLYGCETLLNIINDILDYSKIEAGKLSMERLPFRLDHELEALTKLLRTSAEDKGLELEINLASDVPHTVVSDRLRLRQILTNLINNAIKFTPRGKISLQVTRLLLEEDKNRMKLQFEVSDTGIGMGERTLSGLFQPFEQGDPSISRRHGGTGLGLAICKQLVRMMGGDINVQSAPGTGSTFYFTIWCGTAAQAQRLSNSGDEETQRPGDRVQGLRVLVVDDVDMNRTVARAILTRRGAQVIEAGDGNQALKLLYDTPEDFDVVLMDVHMPGVDGLTATRALRGDPRFAKLPVIALTASAMEQDQNACREAGMTDFLSKPIVPDHLYRMLEKYTGVA